LRQEERRGRCPSKSPTPACRRLQPARLAPTKPLQKSVKKRRRFSRALTSPFGTEEQRSTAERVSDEQGKSKRFCHRKTSRCVAEVLIAERVEKIRRRD